MTVAARSRRPRARRAVAVAVLVAVALLSGCRVAVDVAVEVEADGSGVLSVTTSADAEARAAAEGGGAEGGGAEGGGAEGGGADPLDGVAAVGDSLMDQGWRATDTTDPAGTRAVTLSVDFADPAALERLTGQLADALAATEARPLEPLQLRVTDDRLLLTGSAAIEPTAAVADAGYTPEQAVALLEAEDALGYTVRATFPDEVLRADGARVNGFTAVWDVAPGTRVDIVAEAARPQPVWPWVLGGAGAVLLVLAVGVLVLRRRRSAAGDHEPVAAGEVGDRRRRRSSRPRQPAEGP